MFNKIFSKLPRKSSRGPEHGGSGKGHHGVTTSSKSSDSVTVSQGGTRPGNSSVAGQNHGNRVPLPKVLNENNIHNNPNNGILASYEALPAFRDVPSSEKTTLFVKKLIMCSVVFDFTDPTKHVKEKEIKRQTLVELLDYVTSANAKFAENVMLEVVKMVSANIFRTLSPQPRENKIVDGVDVEEEEPSMDPAWPHLQIVYELFLRFVASPELDPKLAKRYIDQSFILKLLDLFDSEDPREREYLKMTLHRIYGKFMAHRPFIRKAINNVFFNFIFETEKHNGIAEFLEILGSIINGFALPLKEEHKLFLVRILIPLHKPKCLAMYHQQLSYCITQFVEKDCKLADTIIRGLLKYWPITNSSKEVMFLGELEEVLEATQPPEFQRCMVPLFRRIARCLNSPHFQVAERALFLWNNDHIVNLIKQNRKVILPIIFPALERNARSHWNQAVHSLTLNVRKIFNDVDADLSKECLQKFEEDESKEDEVKAGREATWNRLEELAMKKAASGEAVLIGKAPTRPSAGMSLNALLRLPPTNSRFLHNDDVSVRHSLVSNRRQHRSLKAPQRHVFVVEAKGKKGMMARQFQRSTPPPLPKIEDDGNPKFVIFIRMANVYLWYPLSIVTGGTTAKIMVAAKDNFLGKYIYKDTLDRNLAAVIYKDEKEVQKSAFKQYRVLRSATDFRYGYKLVENTNIRAALSTTDVIELPTPDKLKTVLDKVKDFFGDAKESFGKITSLGTTTTEDSEEDANEKTKVKG